MHNQDDVVAEARKWIDAPWRHQGRSIYGIDCAGLILVVGKKLELIDQAYDYSNYQRHPSGANFMAPFKHLLDIKPMVDMQCGDILVFREKTHPCHTGIVGKKYGQLTLIHSDMFQRKTLEIILNQGDWMQRRVACFKYRGLSDG